MPAVTENIQLRVRQISLLFESVAAYKMHISFIKLTNLLTECRAKK
jgi:hypothetical protein